MEHKKQKRKRKRLMQDYQELHMDTEAMRKKLQTMRERKATLLAQVRFLRQEQAVKKGRGKKSKTQLIQVEVSPADTKHVSLPDLNHSGMVHHDETKTKKVPLFDLNQIYGEEEEEKMNNSEERMRLEQSKRARDAILQEEWRKRFT